MTVLTEELRHEIEETGEARLVDPTTQEQYVVIRADIYERMKANLDDLSVDEMRALAVRTFDDADNAEAIP